jgi:histidine triad (HIT) family protein
MSEESIFMKIVHGEVPCHKVYEDTMTLAFLDIHPVQPGHTLVVPKIQVDKLYDLPDDYYQAVMATAKLVARRIEDVLQSPRVAYAVEGFDVPHAHVHLVPTAHGFSDLDPKHAQTEVDNEALSAMVQRLAF